MSDTPDLQRQVAGKMVSEGTHSGRRRLLVILLIGLLFLVGSSAIVLDGMRRHPTSPAIGERLALESSSTSRPGEITRIRVGLLNIQSGIGADGVYNLDRTADAVRDADICGLNEVQGAINYSTHNQAEMLGQMLHRQYLFMPSERWFWRDHFGNGLLSKLPVSHWVRMPLPYCGQGGCRNLTLASIDLGSGKTLSVLVTHLNRKSDRPTQVRMVAALFESLAEPVVLLGDLNTDRDDADLKQVLAFPGVHDCVGEKIGGKSGRIDWILARGCKTADAGIVDHGASDHVMVWADLEVGR